MAIWRALILSMVLTCAPVLATAQPNTPRALDDGWPVAPLVEAGLDPDAMAILLDMIDKGITVPNVHALVIAHDGRLLLEQYWPGEDYNFITPLGVVDHGPATQHDIRSVSKSVTSLLLGIALGDTAEVALSRPISSFLPHRDIAPELEEITLHHVLTMTAGLAWNETYAPYNNRNDFVRFQNSNDPVGYVLSKEQRNPPGERWSYNSGLTEVIAEVIETLTDQPLHDYADEVLFGPLGITNYTWRRPPVWPSDHFPSASAGLRMTARDLAKIGTLVLQKGQWQGRQIVPTDWIATSTTRHIQDNPWGPPGVYGYGYQWYPGTLLSDDAVIRAMGWGDQLVYVLPDLGLVVTILAGNYDTGGGAIGQPILGRIIRAMR